VLQVPQVLQLDPVQQHWTVCRELLGIWTAPALLYLLLLLLYLLLLLLLLLPLLLLLLHVLLVDEARHSA
jgi:hypothetical protein